MAPLEGDDTPPSVQNQTPLGSDRGTPWLDDPSASTSPPRTPAATTPEGPTSRSGPWWSTFVGLGAAQPGRPAPSPGRPRSIADHVDAETVVASRDELLRTVREYMSASAAARGDAPPLPATGFVPPEPRDRREAPPGPKASSSAAASGSTGAYAKPDVAPAEPSPSPDAPPASPPPSPDAPPASSPPSAEMAQSPPSPPPKPAPRPEGPSAMTRPRLLPAGASRPKAPSAAQTDPSLSSFSLDAGGQAPTARYPDAFVTTGLRHVMTRQWSQALDFYRDEARRQPHEAAPELGQGAALLGLNRLEDAAHHFARGFELDPDFPLAQLVMDARPDDPVAWYELAAAMVAERTREAYLCAEIVLTECLGGADDDQLRGRAKRVQRDIARTLAQRERRDEGRFPPDGDRGPRRHAGLIAGAALLVLALIAGWLATRTPLPDEPTPPATNLPTPPAARAVPRRPPTPLPSSAPASRVVEAPSALPKH